MWSVFICVSSRSFSSAFDLLYHVLSSVWSFHMQAYVTTVKNGLPIYLSFLVLFPYSNCICYVWHHISYKKAWTCLSYLAEEYSQLSLFPTPPEHDYIIYPYFMLRLGKSSFFFSRLSNKEKKYLLLLYSFCSWLVHFLLDCSCFYIYFLCYSIYFPVFSLVDMQANATYKKLLS